VPAQATKPVAASMVCSLAMATVAGSTCVMHGGQMFLARSALAALTRLAAHLCSQGSSSKGRPVINVTARA